MQHTNQLELYFPIIVRGRITKAFKQQQVLDLKSFGKSNKEISCETGLARQTIERVIKRGKIKENRIVRKH